VQLEEPKDQNQIVPVQMVNMKTLHITVKIVHTNVLHVQEVQLVVTNVLMLEKLNQLVNVLMDSTILKDLLFVEFVKFNVKHVLVALQHA